MLQTKSVKFTVKFINIVKFKYTIKQADIKLKS